MSVVEAENRPDYVHPALKAVLPDLELVDDLIAGTRRMWKRAPEAGYIRKWKDEAPEVYAIRSKSETLYEGLGRTRSAATGMLFAKPPKLEWNGSDTRLKPHWDNIDAAGTAGHVFVKRLSDASIADGLGLLLVDFTKAPRDPKTGERVLVTAENEERLGLRPKWASYPRSSIRSWITMEVANREEIVQVVLHEPSAERDGMYGIKTVDRFRVLAMQDGAARWDIFKKLKGPEGDVFELEEGDFFRNRTGATSPRLPIAIAYTGAYQAPLQASIPLLGVAWANLSHWQISTDLRFYLSLCAFPQPTVVGKLQEVVGANGARVPGTLKVGPMVVVHLQEGGSFEWKELQGTSITKLQEEVEKREKQMGQMGMSFLAPDSRHQETAEAKRIDSTAENSTLATAAQGIDDAVNLAWELHCWYEGIERAQVPVFTMNRDFESTAMDHDTMVAYVRAVKDAGLPPRMLLEAWQQGGRIPPDADLDLLEMEMLGATLTEPPVPDPPATEVDPEVDPARNPPAAGMAA